MIYTYCAFSYLWSNIYFVISYKIIKNTKLCENA